MFWLPKAMLGENTDNITFVNAQQARATCSCRNAMGEKNCIKPILNRPVCFDISVLSAAEQVGEVKLV